MATAALAKALPDGSTFLLASNAFLINPALKMKLPYDTRADFTPISMIATQPIALIATPTCLCKRYPSTNWSSTSGPQTRAGSTCRLSRQKSE